MRKGELRPNTKCAALPPQAYRGLPRSVSRYVRRHGYTIPQARGIRQHSVVRGRFDDDGRDDWAVLASRGGQTALLVFWRGSAAKVTRLASHADFADRSISVVGRQYILEHSRRYGAPKPPPIRHDAIDDAFLGKGSVVFYFDGTRWHKLQGAD